MLTKSLFHKGRANFGIGLIAEKTVAESQILANARKPSAATEKRYWFPPLRRAQRWLTSPSHYITNPPSLPFNLGR
jgi:hypothetical protein